jgi:hypothetical protein
MDRRASALGRERHEGDIAGAPDGDAQLALMSGTVAGNTAWDDLAPLGDQVSQALDILIVDIIDLIRTKAADFLPLKPPFGRHRSLASFLPKISIPMPAHAWRVALEWHVILFHGVPFTHPPGNSTLSRPARLRQELHAKRNDFVFAALLPLLTFPRAILETAFHEDRLTLTQILATALRLLPEHGHIDETGIIFPLVSLFHPVIHCQP